MEPTSNERPPDDRAMRKAAALAFESPEQLVELARQHYANNHPNPSRSTCPGRATLRASVFSGGLPGDELSAHMLGCSECFRDYKALLSSYRAHGTEVRPRALRWGELIKSLFARPMPALTAALALLLLLFAGTYLWWGKKPPAGTDAERADTKPASAPLQTPATDGLAQPTNGRAQTEPSPQPPEAAESVSGRTPLSPLVTRRGPARDERTRPREARKPKQPEGPDEGHPSPSPEALGGEEAIEADLSRYEKTRGGGGGTITLRRVRASLTLRLPEGALKGEYKVSLSDAAGRRVRAVSAESQDGRVIRFRLNFATLAVGKYSLELTDVAGNVFGYTLSLQDGQ